MKARVTTTDDGAVCVLVPGEDGKRHSLTMSPEQADEFGRALKLAAHKARGHELTHSDFAKSRGWRL